MRQRRLKKEMDPSWAVWDICGVSRGLNLTFRAEKTQQRTRKQGDQKEWGSRRGSASGNISGKEKERGPKMTFQNHFVRGDPEKGDLSSDERGSKKRKLRGGNKFGW